MRNYQGYRLELTIKKIKKQIITTLYIVLAVTLAFLFFSYVVVAHLASSECERLIEQSTKHPQWTATAWEIEMCEGRGVTL